MLASRDPDDAAVARLFPRAVDGDEDADQELRHLIHDDLAATKREALEELDRLLDGGVRKGRELRVRLDEEQQVLLLGVLNDLRLAIGARVGIEQLDRDELDPDHPDTYRVAVMDHLGMWQELLLAHLDPPAVRDDLPGVGDDGP